MSFHLVLVAALCIGFSHSYKEGPPIIEDSTLCQTLFPSGHNANASANASPFTVTASQDCFAAGQTVQLVFTSSSDKIGGFFIQARKGAFKTATTSYGTFSSSTAKTSPYKCFNKDASSIGHKGDEPKVQSLTINWKAPSASELAEDVNVGGTLLLHEKVFWMNQYKILKYNTACVQKDLSGSGRSVHSASLVAAIVLLVKLFL